MGLISTVHGRRKYVVQLEVHQFGGVELPVEKLRAIFLEGSLGSGASREVAETLQRIASNPKEPKYSSIIQRAKEAGSEIWVGDLKHTTLEHLSYVGAAAITSGAVVGALAAVINRRAFLKKLGALAAIIAVHPFTHTEILRRPGDAGGRKASRAIVSVAGKPFSVIDLRNRVMAHQIKKLAEKSSHTNIGASLGVAHADIINMLEKGYELTREEISQIRQRSKGAGDMFRCRYNKTKGRWKVEKYQL